MLLSDRSRIPPPSNTSGIPTLPRFTPIPSIAAPVEPAMIRVAGAHFSCISSGRGLLKPLPPCKPGTSPVSLCTSSLFSTYRTPRTEYSCRTTRSASRSRMGPVRVTRPCEAMTSIEFGWEATRPSLARTRSPNTSSGTAWCLSEAQACARNPPARFPRSRRALSRARLQKLLAWTALSRSHMRRLFPETGSNRYMSRLPTATPATKLIARPY